MIGFSFFLQYKKNRNIKSSFLFFVLLFTIFSEYAVAGISSLQDISSHAEACLIMNGENEKILFEKNAYEKRFPASCTKVATLVYVLSSPHLDLKMRIPVPHEAVRILGDVEKSRDNFSKYPSYIQEISGTSARFTAGEKITLEDALYGMMLISGNDAANTLAYHFGNGEIDFFMKNLNLFLLKLGCQSTHFMNPHGLHHPEHLSSAYDLAVITRYGMNRFPLFRKIVRSMSYTKAKTNKQEAVTWRQSNKLLQKGNSYFYEHAVGVKTGRHKRAMENIIAAGEVPGRKVIAVFLQCPDRSLLFQQAKKALQYFLEEKKIKKPILYQGPILLTREVVGHTPLRLKVRESFEIEAFPSEMPEIRTIAQWQQLPLSIKKDDYIGDLSIFLDEQEVKKVKLYALEDKKPTFLSLIYYIQNLFFFFNGRVFSLFFLILSALFGIFLLRRMRRKGR